MANPRPRFINGSSFFLHDRLVYRAKNFRSTHVKTTWPTPGGRWCIRKLANKYGWWRAYSTGQNNRYARDFTSFKLALYYATMMAYIARRFPTKDGTHNKVARAIVMKHFHKQTLLPSKRHVDVMIKEYRDM